MAADPPRARPARAAGCGRCRGGARVHLRAGGRARRHPGALAGQADGDRPGGGGGRDRRGAGDDGRTPVGAGHRGAGGFGASRAPDAATGPGGGGIGPVRPGAAVDRVVPADRGGPAPGGPRRHGVRAVRGELGPGLGTGLGDRLRRHRRAVAPAAGPAAAACAGRRARRPEPAVPVRVRPQVQGVLPGQGPGMRCTSAPPPRPGAVRDARHLRTAGIEPDGG